MSDNDRWIVIPRWDDFQHYKNRSPVWIKTFVRQVRDDEYLELSMSQRGLLHDLRMLYAESNGQLSESGASRKLVRSQSDARYWKRNLEALNHAGFVVFDASKPLASRDRDRDIKNLGETNNLKTLKRPCPECGHKLTPVAWHDHMRNVHGVEDTA